MYLATVAFERSISSLSSSPWIPNHGLALRHRVAVAEVAHLTSLPNFDDPQAFLITHSSARVRIRRCCQGYPGLTQPEPDGRRHLDMIWCLRVVRLWPFDFQRVCRYDAGSQTASQAVSLPAATAKAEPLPTRRLSLKLTSNITKMRYPEQCYNCGHGRRNLLAEGHK